MSKIFRVQVFFEESHIKTRPYYDDAIKWLNEKGFNAKSSNLFDTFFVHCKEKTVETFKNRLDKCLLALSFRNNDDCAFIITDEFSDKNKTTTSTLYLVPPSDNGLEYIEKVTKSNVDLLNKLKELRLFNAQVDLRAKLIYGLSLLEEWFDVKPKHCLTKEEQRLIIKKIQELSLDNKKQQKAITIIKDSSFFSEKNRNQRISEVVQKYCGCSKEKTEEKIRELYKVRGKSAHTTADIELEKNLNFLKSLFSGLLYSKYNFIKINLH